MPALFLFVGERLHTGESYWSKSSVSLPALIELARLAQRSRIG